MGFLKDFTWEHFSQLLKKETFFNSRNQKFNQNKFFLKSLINLFILIFVSLCKSMHRCFVVWEMCARSQACNCFEQLSLRVCMAEATYLASAKGKNLILGVTWCKSPSTGNMHLCFTLCENVGYGTGMKEAG